MSSAYTGSPDSLTGAVSAGGVSISLRKSEYSSIKSGRHIKTEITPPLAKLWTFEAPGKIVGAGAIDDRVFLTCGRSGWEVLDAATGECRRSIEKGPPVDEFLYVVPVPQSEVFLLGGMDHEECIWDMARDERRPLVWRYACHLSDAVMLHDGERAWRVKGSEITEMLHVDGTVPPCRTSYGDPLCYVSETTEDGTSTRLTARDMLSGDRVWERTFPFPELRPGCWGRWLSLQAELECGERHHVEVLDALTGETVWCRADPEAPPQKGARSSILGIYGDGIALLYSRPVEDVMSHRSFIRLATGEHLWTTHEISSVCFASGRIVWLYERTARCCDWNRYDRYFETKVETESITARDVETGAELMRIKGNPSPFAFAGRVYTRSGKKLTCWGPPAEAKLIPAGARERRSLSLTDAPPVASAAESRRGAVPSSEGEWEDLWFELEVTGETGRVPIRALLDALQKKYAGTVLHPGGVLEVRDAVGRSWGSLFFEAQFLPEGVSESDADTRIAGFRLTADEAVRSPIHAALRRHQAVWDVTN